MNWLEKIDKSYLDIAEKNNNEKYIFTFPCSFSKNNNILIYKDGNYLKNRRSKLKILICEEGNRRIYLSDDEIIDMVQVSKYSEEFINYMKDLQKNRSRKEKFRLLDNEFDLYCPNSFNFQFEEKEIKTKADFDISFNSLMVLALLIIDKELTFGNADNARNQVQLFLILTSFYSLGKYENELKKVDYPTNFKSAKEAYSKLSYIERSDLKKSIGEIKIDM